MFPRQKNARYPAWSIVLAAAALGVLCYGLLIPWLGFYWDDFSYQYSLRVFGPLGFVDYVARDRPASAWIYVVTSTLFGDHPLPYQLLNLGLRIGCAAALWWLVRTLWPRRGAALAWAPLAFIVYPGFWQQPISFIYNLHWANLAQELLSLGCMILAVRAAGRRRLVWTAAALALMLNVFSLEYAFGLEGLRPLLLFLVLGAAAPAKRVQRAQPGLRARLWQTLKFWLPYLLVNAAFLVWTLVIFNNNMYDPGGRLQAPGLLDRLLSAARDLFQVGFLPWLRLFDPLGALPFDSVSDGLFWLAAGVGGLLSAAALLRILPEDPAREGAERDAWAGEVALVGLWALVVAGIPIWGVGLDPETRFPYDRFTLPFSVGAALLLAAFLEGLVRGRVRKVALFAVVCGLAAGAQFQNTNTFRREWDNLPAFLAQLAWRAPAIEPGTLLLTHDLPFKVYSDYSLSGVLNMQYAPGQGSAVMPYLLMYIGDRTGGSLPGLQPGLAVEKNFRSLDFSGSTAQALVFFYSPPGCLRVLDPARAHELPVLPAVYSEALAISRPELILANPSAPAVPPAQWFPAQDETSWCAAYERADLARQRGDWTEVERIGADAFARGLVPGALSELGLFAEARARLGDAGGALALLQPALDEPLAGRAFACREWAYLVAQGLVDESGLSCGD